MNRRVRRIALSKGVNHMAFFKDIGKQVSELAQTVSKKTGEAAEVGRLNGRKQGITQQIEALYAQIGKSYFATREAAAHEQADKLCGQVIELQGETEKLERMIDRIRNQRRCPDCGQVQSSSARFCANCGARMPEEEPVQADQTQEAQEAPQVTQSVQAGEKGDVAVEIDWPEPKAPDAEDADAQD